MSEDSATEPPAPVLRFYKPGSPPGTYEHIGRWCFTCGDTQPFYRSKNTREPFWCTECERAEGEPALGSVVNLKARLATTERRLVYARTGRDAAQTCLAVAQAALESIYGSSVDDDAVSACDRALCEIGAPPRRDEPANGGRP